jgi:hypothetical protein
MQTAFPDINVLIPEEPELAVMKGAVLFGFNPSVITARVAMLTYGTNSYIPFKNGIHPENKKVVVDGEEFCAPVFSSVASTANSVPPKIIFNEIGLSEPPLVSLN